MVLSGCVYIHTHTHTHILLQYNIIPIYNIERELKLGFLGLVECFSCSREQKHIHVRDLFRPPLSYFYLTPTNEKTMNIMGWEHFIIFSSNSNQFG